MQRLSKSLCISLVLAVALAGPHAFAQGKGHGNLFDSDDRAKHHDRDDHRNKDRDHGKDKGKDKDRDRDHDKFRDHDRDHHLASNRPAGWDKGKKTGWGNCNVPPGQAKKLGCHPNSSRRVSHHLPAHIDHDRHANHDRRIDRDKRKDRITDHRRHDLKRDAKPAPVVSNQPVPVTGGGRTERTRVAAMRR